MTMKLVKTATALALGASLISTAVVSTDASAASKYKISKGKLVIAKTGKVAKGFVTYKSLVYKDGKKLTGLKGKTYYKAGKKATGTYKGAYYYKGAKKVTTGTYKGAYYVKGVKKVTTGLYNNRYYKSGVKATGTYKGAYYVKGVKKVTTGYYAGAYYVKGYKKVTTGFYNDVLYIKGKENKELAIFKDSLFDGSKLNEGVVLFDEKLFDGYKLNKGYKLYKEDLYNNEKLNEGQAIFGDKLYVGSKLSEGLVTFVGEDKKEVVYNNGELANGTFEVEGKEVAYEDGKEVAAKVASVEAINATTVEVKFNKTVDKDAAETAGIVAIDGVTFEGSKGKLAEDGRTLTLSTTADTTVNVKSAKVTVKPVLLKGSKDVKTAEYNSLLTYEDTVAPTAVDATAKLVDKNEFVETVSVKFSEKVKAEGVFYVNGKTVTVKTTNSSDVLELNVADLKLKVGENVEIKMLNVKDLANNNITPNPVTISTKVQAADAPDTVAPVVESVTTVATKAENKVVVTFSKELDKTKTEAIKTAYLSKNGQTLGTLKTVSVDKNKVTYTFDGVTLTDNLATATLYIPKDSVVDTKGLVFAADYSTSVSFSQDLVAPTLVSSEIVENKLVLNFSEEVKLDATKLATDFKLAATNLVTGKTESPVAFPLVTEAGVTQNTTVSKDGKVVTIDLSSKSNAEKELTYIASYTTDLFKDLADNNAKEFSKTITLSKSTVTAPEADTKAPVVTLVDGFIKLDGETPKATDSEYKIVYTISDDKALDFASIRDLGNYTIAGKSLPTGSTITTDAASTDSKENVKVTITIPKKSVTSTLTGVFAVKGVKDIAGNTIEGVLTTSTKNFLTLAEGIAPTLKSAVAYKADNKVIIELSEALKTEVAGDFLVSVNGTEFVAATGIKLATGADAGLGKYELTLATDALATATKVEVKTIETPTSKDSSENVLEAVKTAILATLK
ncbi:hypothetical protein KZO01_20060 [Kurthia zopfii]|uniref:Uncharacterized protein n=1 Tax=Kurthia zopfii TaxID=1650 RepID=A0A8B4Q712_9BACL|nr:Ig-like domain-containing protein [Kurthia zopfii]PWI22503.1 hypothetical protein DF281_06705 [Kurthia zopfii]TDR38632.1 hypothetical protein DFR61_1157 [Kurthia zopfii]GEK31697.1 hypothetical protein KZO01_20060 [Kurthia zopfii]STX08761.1 Uncharacterised protein [Kurthia zopfii]